MWVHTDKENVIHGKLLRPGDGRRRQSTTMMELFPEYESISNPTDNKENIIE
jgi:hypothetical protein